eukprot:scpid57375/ scgid8695/ 
MSLGLLLLLVLRLAANHQSPKWRSLQGNTSVQSVFATAAHYVEVHSRDRMECCCIAGVSPTSNQQIFFSSMHMHVLQRFVELGLPSTHTSRTSIPTISLHALFHQGATGTIMVTPGTCRLQLCF